MAQKSKIAQKTTKKTAAPFAYEPKKARREIKRPDSLRGQAEALLLKGAKIAEVEKLVAASDNRRKGKMTTLREKLIKIEAKVVRHRHYVTFQMAEVAIPRALFADILRKAGLPE